MKTRGLREAVKAGMDIVMKMQSLVSDGVVPVDPDDMKMFCSELEGALDDIEEAAGQIEDLLG